MKTKTVSFFAINRNAKTVCALPGFADWDHVRSAFYVGLVMPDGRPANGIGRTANLAAAAAKSGYRLLS